MKKKSQKSVTKLKKELDSWFSLFIRLRNADSSGFIECFTCGCKKHYKQGMHCGHFPENSFAQDIRKQIVKTSVPDAIFSNMVNNINSQ